jgi:hypothetical protein
MASAVNAIATNRNWLDTTKKVANTYLNFSFGCGQDQKFVESIFGRGENKVKMGVKDAWKEAKLGESWWGSFKNAFSPSGMGKEWAQYGAEGAGTLKKSGKFFMKRMPFIGNAIALVCEAPNLGRAFTDKEHGGGIGTGLVETAKAGIKFTAFAAGAALGSLLLPGIGGAILGIAGGMAGGWIADKILGKSFTDNKEEMEAEKAKQTQQMQQPVQTAQAAGSQGAMGGPSATNPYGQSGFSSRNSIFETDWQDKDLMAMGAGLA